MEKSAKTESKAKSGRLEAVRKWLYDRRIYFIAFFIPVVVMALAYGFFDVYPIGNLLGASFEGRNIKHDGSVLVLDLNGQYVYYFEALRDAIWGDGSILYNWSRNMSGEFVGIIGYYLASPFTWIVMILPRTMLLESLLIMQLSKLGAIGVTFCYYLQKSKKVKPVNSLVFSTLFALCAYAVIQLMDPMWIDGLVLMPLIMLGIERLVDEGKKVNYIIPLAVMFVANFYIGFMMAIFCVLYFLFYLFLGTEKDNIPVKDMAKTGLTFGYCSLIAGMCSAFMVLPVYNALKLGKFEFSEPDFSLKLQFDSIDIFSKLLPSSYDTVRNEGLPEIYCGTLTILLLPLYFLNSKISSRNKIGHALLVAALFFSMYIKPLDMRWHGGQVPNWLPYRYSFMMSFVLLVMAAQAFENLDGIKSGHIGATFAGILAYLLIAEKLFKYENIEVLNGLWFTAGCVLCFSILVSAYRENLTSKAIPITIVVLVAGELLLSTFETIKDINKDVIYSMRSSYVDYMEAGRAAVKEMEKLDDGLYRSEKVAQGTLSRTVNDDIGFGLKGITHSSSIMNAKIIDTLGKLGYVSRGHYTRYEGNTPLTDSLIGIKYVLNNGSSGIDDMYEYVETTVTEHKTSSTNIDIYRNPYALPVGYMVDDDILNVDISSTVNPFINQNNFMSAMIGEQKEYFKKLNFSQDPIYSGISVANAGVVDKYIKDPAYNDWTVDYFVHADTNDMVYLFFPTTYEVQVNLWKGQWNQDTNKYDYPSFLGYFFEDENYCLKRIGRYTPNQNFSVRMTVYKDDAFMSDQLFYRFDEELFKKDIAKLHERQWNITKWSDTHIEGTVNADSNQVFFTSVPYEPGWTVKVDGKKAEIIPLANDSFIGVRLAPGQHEISMSFFPSGMPLGILLSVTGIGCVVILIMTGKKKGFKAAKSKAA